MPRRKLFGGMADAIFTGHKDHCHWRNPGDLLRVLSSEAGQVCGGETERFCRFADGGLRVCIGVSRFRVIQQVATGLDVFRFIHLCESVLNVLPHAINLCGIKVAQFNWKLGAAGDNVDRSGGNLDVSHVAHGCPLQPVPRREQQARPLKQRRGHLSCDSWALCPHGWRTL